jgi:3-oxoacyl-[acyl-carrier-protein] synthase-1
MKRVVITGLGIVSSIGNNAEEVLASLKSGRSGITKSTSFEEVGLKSNVWGKPELDIKDHIDRKALRFMGDAAGYAYVAMEQAIKSAKLTDEQVSNFRTGIVAGSGGASSIVVFVVLVLTLFLKQWVVPFQLV